MVPGHASKLLRYASNHRPLSPYVCVLSLPHTLRSSGWVWEHQDLLLEKEAVLPMRHFMLRMIADKAIPLPGDVDLLTGGPPCQVYTTDKFVHGQSATLSLCSTQHLVDLL